MFELLSQPGEMKRWVGGLIEFNSIDPGPALGARAEQVVEVVGKRWHIESQITRYEPPWLLQSTLAPRAFDSTVPYALEDEPGGRTIVHGEIETEYHLGVNRLLGGLIRRQAQRKLEDDLDRLKTLAEAG